METASMFHVTDLTPGSANPKRGLITLEIMEGTESPSLAPVVASLASLHAAAGDPRGESRALWRRVVELLEVGLYKLNLL